VQYAGAANMETGAPTLPIPAMPAPAPGTAPAASTTLSSNASGETQPFAVVHAQESLLNVVSKKPGITLFRRAASAGFNGTGTVSGYSEVCTTPCNVSMPSGTHTFAIAKAGGTPREADPVMLPAGKATMTVGITDRTPIRLALGALGAAGLIAGFGMALSESGDTSGAGNIAGPLVLAAAGAGLFGLAFAISDGSTVAVDAEATSNMPANRPSAWLDRRARDTSPLRDRCSGVTLRVRF
jgi:hypothetical protein